MSLLGSFIKQPVEIEIYGIQFVNDMTSTDEIESAWQIISRETAPAWDQVVQTESYTALLTDNERTIVTTNDVVLPIDALEGYRLYVANKHPTIGIFVGSINVPAMGATVVILSNGTWVEEAKSTSFLVNTEGDQRVRVRVFGGTPWQAYKVQVTVNTNEERTLQDEFIIEIEES